MNKRDVVVGLWHLHTDYLKRYSLETGPRPSLLPEAGAAGSQPLEYVNAKVVLLGETGVGKTGLAIVLSGKPYRPTDSTHSHSITLFDVYEKKTTDGRRERRETLL